jgi:hypothetical protein
MTHCGARHVEVAVNIGAKRAIELLIGDVLDRFLVLLIGGIVDDDIEPAKRVDRAFDGFRTKFRLLHVAWNQQRAPAFGLDGFAGHLRI